MKEKTFITKSSEETKDLARKIAKNLKGGEVLLLFGNLGSGKTTFVQGLAEGLGIKERIISPTFIIIRHHKLKDRVFYHVDLYRIESSKELEELGLNEILNNKENIIAIEWAEKLKTLPKIRTEIYFEYISENEREITIKDE